MTTLTSYESVLDAATMIADPLADRTIATILGPWPDEAAQHSAHWHNINLVNQQFAYWQSNASLHQGLAPDLPPAVQSALREYLQQGQILPPWADLAKIERAETLFYEYGVLSCILLFCSSLPECYVIPDLAAVLHIAGQLDEHTDARVRATAAMIFPVMLPGGLSQADGSGIAQILKVRLIHATIRNLILHGDPEQTLQDMQNQLAGAGQIAANTEGQNQRRNLGQQLFAHGWDAKQDGLPCNQEELAYTLLTFSYVFLRSMRRLGLGLAAEDEVAYLHAWNVVGHILGIRSELMAHDMAQAKALFIRMQERGRLQQRQPDPRPQLGRALMQAMENVIPLELFKPFPSLMTRYLCGKQSAHDIGVAQRPSTMTRWLFEAVMGAVLGIDRIARKFWPHFAISRFITRVIGMRFLSEILMSQTRPLKLPDSVLSQMNQSMQTWQVDEKAPKWMQVLEKRWRKK
ncbi:MAG: DUF2236 domain-containing protein [Burkholderiales bacterium]|nr:DUF2236 domain-containing protein [Burkholderiales bacterium]